MAQSKDVMQEQIKEILRYMDEIRYVRRKLTNHQNVLSEAWKGSDGRRLNQIENDTIRKIKKIENNLDELYHDLLKIIELEELKEGGKTNGTN